MGRALFLCNAGIVQSPHTIDDPIPILRVRPRTPAHLRLDCCTPHCNGSSARPRLRTGPTPVLDAQQDGFDRHYVRCDEKMSTLVYRSQVIRDVFGTSAAILFMNVMKVDATVAQRVLRSPKAKLRR